MVEQMGPPSSAYVHTEITKKGVHLRVCVRTFADYALCENQGLETLISHTHTCAPCCFSTTDFLDIYKMPKVCTPFSGYFCRYNAETRMIEMRRRVTQMGIQADRLQPEWCRQNSGQCYDSGDNPHDKTSTTSPITTTDNGAKSLVLSLACGLAVFLMLSLL